MMKLWQPTVVVTGQNVVVDHVVVVIDQVLTGRPAKK